MSRAISRAVARVVRAAGFPVSAAADILTPSDDMPDGDFVLFLTETRDRLLVKSTAAPTVTITVDPQWKQALINVVENERTITENVDRYMSPTASRRQMSNLQLLHEAILLFSKNYRQLSRMALPENAITTGKIISVSETGSGDYNIDIELTHTVPASTQWFLTGVDEDHLFICLLPRACVDVNDAHTALRPPGLHPDTIRQGEFFFEPTELVFDSFDTGSFGLKNCFEDSFPSDGEYDENDHVVSIITQIGNEFYTRGPVKNTRHKTIWLENRWYRVVKNLELPTPDSAQYWD